MIKEQLKEPQSAFEKLEKGLLLEEDIKLRCPHENLVKLSMLYKCQDCFEYLAKGEIELKGKHKYSITYEIPPMRGLYHDVVISKSQEDAVKTLRKHRGKNIILIQITEKQRS